MSLARICRLRNINGTDGNFKYSPWLLCVQGVSNRITQDRLGVILCVFFNKSAGEMASRFLSFTTIRAWRDIVSSDRFNRISSVFSNESPNRCKCQAARLSAKGLIYWAKGCICCSCRLSAKRGGNSFMNAPCSIGPHCTDGLYPSAVSSSNTHFASIFISFLYFPSDHHITGF